MLPKKARRQRALSVPTSEVEKPTDAESQRNAISASALTKYKEFFSPSYEQGESSQSHAREPQPGPSHTGPLGAPSATLTSRCQTPRTYSDKRPLISPRVFNFYELAPRYSEAGKLSRGSKSSPIVLGDDHHLELNKADAALRGMSSKRFDVGGNKVDSPFICSICGKICGSQTQLLIHQQHSHKYSCPICPESFTKKELLQTHMLHHWPNSEHYICNIENCNRRFSNAVLLQKHIEHEHVVVANQESPNRRRGISESSDWSPVPAQIASPSSPSSFKTPSSSSWQPPDSPAPPDYFRSPSGSITSPVCRRSIGSEGGPFKPYRSPGPDRLSTKTLVDEHVKYLQGLRDSSHITQYITQQVIAQQASLGSDTTTTTNKLLLEQHIVQQQQQSLLSSPFLQSRAFELPSQSILAPQPIKHSLGLLKRRHTSSESSAIEARTEQDACSAAQRARGDSETRVDTPEPSPHLPESKPVSMMSPGLENVFVDVDPSMGGLELLGQVSSQLSRLNEGEPVRSKPKPEPLELPAEQNLTLTPPYTGTPRYLWTPTTTATSTVAFFSPEPRRIRIGNEFQATIPDLLQNNQSGATTVPLTRPVYTPPTDPVEEQRREHFFRETVPVYPDTEFLHHCVHKADGNLDAASRMARCPIQTKYPDDHPLHNYRYNGRWKWTLDDQDRFFLLFQQFGKNLLQIARWMPDKKVCDIVEYFYMWKIQNPELYQKWRNQVQPYRLIQPVIEYEQRAAPAKTSRARNRKEIVYYETEAYTTNDSRGNKEIKFRQKKVVNPYSSPARPARSNKPPNPQPLGSYKCKVCGKEFQKVKSRSAHMKTHKRQQNAVNSLITAPTLLQQTYHSQQLQQHLLQLKQLTPEMLPTTSVEQLLQMTSRDHMAIAAAAHQSREITMATTRESVMTSRQSVTSVISSQDRTDNSGAT